MDRVPMNPDDLPALLGQLQATPPDGRVFYLTVNAAGETVADWRSGGKLQTAVFGVSGLSAGEDEGS